VDSATFSQADLAQFIQIADVVNLPEKAGLSIVAPLDNMLRHSGKVESRLAWHLAGPY
jgi:hypothetical protein